jgi:hypothetical protein
MYCIAMRQRNAALALIGRISRCLFSPRLDDRLLQNRPALPPFAAELGRGADLGRCALLGASLDGGLSDRASQ